MAENTEPAARADDKPPDGMGPVLRRNFGSKRRATPAPDAAPPELEEKIANLVDSVKVLQSHLATGRPADESAPEAEPKTRRLKRFQRVGGSGGAAGETAEPEVEPVLDHDVRGNEATVNKNIAWPRLTRPDEAPASLGARGAAYARRHPFILWALVQVTGLGLLLLGYWAGQSISGEAEEQAASPDSAAKAASANLQNRTGVNDRGLKAAGDAFRAEKNSDLNAARQIWEEAATGRLHVPGAEYRLAMIEIGRKDLTAADIHLTKSLAAGEMMASCYFVQACFAGKKSNYSEVAKQISHAVMVEPFNAKYLFCWGEALRRAGKTQAGIEAITQALVRPARPADLELFEFKRRLARSESGHDAAFNAELADHLAKPSVAGDWLLLAAAQELARAAYPAAAGHLREALRVLPPQVYGLLTHDYVFQAYANRAEIGPLLNVPPPIGSDKPLDPGAWPADEADPAVWPPFAPAL